jgi:hypothetical protein
MDYLLSREKTSSERSNPLRARSILVDCLISTDNLYLQLAGQDISFCNYDLTLIALFNF